eukprot:TRINITY_DN4453_c0_g1_i1.p1 TRINITY_DN4453_c0_g1~~TRINITY_DN4453_c0_g1_i1.p1  ORF type:complete len:338 (-),score=78.45 TRINITY_DN4453_c0_g1_i1:278-1255(-)
MTKPVYNSFLEEVQAMQAERHTTPWCMAVLKKSKKYIAKGIHLDQIMALVKDVLVSPNVSRKILNRVYEVCTSFYDKIYLQEIEPETGNQILDIVFEHLERFTEKQIEYMTSWKNGDFSYFDGQYSSKQSKPKVVGDCEAPRRLRFAETVLQRRTERIIVVLEQCYNNFNQQAVLRTAECLGIMYIYIISPETTKNAFASKITRKNEKYLEITQFSSTTECIAAIKEQNAEIWATDLSPEAIPMNKENLQVLPERVAIVFGNETSGCSEEILQASDKTIYYPMGGFCESLNLSVAAALVLNKLFLLFPEIRGDLPEDKKSEIRYP